MKNQLIRQYLDINLGSRPIGCGDPGSPENGRRAGDDFRIGATIYYSCNTNFILVGPDSRTCQPDGTWTGFLPVCLQAEGTGYIYVLGIYKYLIWMHRSQLAWNRFLACMLGLEIEANPQSTNTLL